jgi:hypothetical protein
MKLHKTEIARHQIDTAIDLFLEDKDFISALTLAGAGEELTGKLIERAGGENMLQKLHAWYEKTTGEEIKFGEFAKNTNFTRNTLKHANNAEEDELELQRWETVQMIMRAMTNYKELVGEPSEKMKVMAGWIAKNKGAYENME